MATVYVKTISAYDAANAQVVNFGYLGNQCFKNRIVVYNSSTATAVYDNTVTTYILSHTIPAGALTNGTSYYCTITAYYMESNIEYSVTSSASNVWKCLTTATWAINGLSEGSTIGNSYYALTMNYSQAQGEAINEYYIALYNQAGTTYWSSGALYDVAASTTVTGLPNDTALYARAYGTTVSGLQLDTGKFLVNISYVAPTLYSVAYLENDKWHGWVKVTTNVLDIEGDAIGTYSYIDSKYINLSNSSVTFRENFSLSNDFVIEASGYSVYSNKTVLTISGTGLSITVTFRSGAFNSGELFFAEIKEANSGYVLYSNMIAMPSSSDFVHLWIQRKDGLYNCTIANMGVGQ